MSQSEQTLEWTYQYRFGSGDGILVAQHCAFNLILVPVTLLAIPLALLIPREIGFIFAVILLCGMVLFVLYVLLFCERPSLKLRINRHTITLITTNLFGTKERRMNTNGATIIPVHSDLLQRLFTFDMFRTASAYHIEISRSGETFLFPCVDEAEQRQILATIKEFGVGDVR